MKSSAFIHLATWRRAYARFASKLGVRIEGGDSSQLPGGGTAFHFDEGTVSEVPFWVTRTGLTRSWINGGVLIFCGQVFYFPSADFYCPPPCIIGLRLNYEFSASPNAAPGDPWDITAFISHTPRLEFLPMVSFYSSPPINAAIRDLNAPPAGAIEDITATAGSVLWPLATLKTDQTLQMWTTGNICLELRQNGRLLPTPGYPSS